MKNLICILLSVMMLLSLAACAEKEPPAPTQPAATVPDVSLNDLIYTKHDKTYIWHDSDDNTYTVQVTLPALHPLGDFAEQYNEDVERYASELFDNILYCLENEIWLNTVSVSYEAYLNGDLLSVLITEQFDSGEADYQTATFDLTLQKQLTTAELASRLLGLDYPAFLMASSEYLAQDFREQYENGEMDEDQLESFSSILAAIPADTIGLYNRSLFPDENGEVMMHYQSVQMTDDWWAGLSTEDRIGHFDLESLDWTPVPEEDALAELLTLPVSGRGAYPEYYSYILQLAFADDPEGFTAGLAALDEEQRGYTIDNLFYATWDEETAAIRETCEDLLSRQDLSDDIQDILRLLLDMAQ